jgi:hypothetical protein
LDPTLVAAGDAGMPCLITQPDGAVAKVFANLARQILEISEK